MQIVYMNGGLGNQLYQYVFLRWLERYSGESCVVDNAPFQMAHTPHNGYELERVFGLKLSLLSDYFSEDVWQYLLKQRAPGAWGVAQQLLDGGMRLSVALEDSLSSIQFNGRIISYHPGDAPLKLPGHIYYHGHWLGDFLFNFIRETILEELQFPPIVEPLAKQYMENIVRSQNPVAIHIRRGDMAKLGWTASPAHFFRAIQSAERRWDVDQYFLFSDDLPWCNAHADDLGLSMIKRRLVIVQGNTGASSYRDMQLMSLCHHRISDRSSFSFFANLLCQYPEKEDITRWDG